MNQDGVYGSPAGFRRALTDRLRTLADHSKWTLPQLQRQIAYDRLLERLYLVDDGWVVKGAAALIARGLAVRETVDLDLYRAQAIETVERELREASATDLGDWFTFEIRSRTRPSGEGARVRLWVGARVGTTLWTDFAVDLVGDEVRMTGQPDDVPALARVAMPNVEQHGYRAYPLVDHIAHKVAAILDRYGPGGMPSTRYKDLVDLVAIVTEASVEAASQRAALLSEADRRGLTLPAIFDVADAALWGPGYAAEAERSLLPLTRTLDEALAMIRPFLHPLLDGTAAGQWDPHAAAWTV